MADKEYVTFADCWAFIRLLAKEHEMRRFTGVYALPRGGLTLGVMASHALHIPLLAAPCKGCVVIDDIADTGLTLQHYKASDFYIATMFYHRQSVVVPDLWMREKRDGWIVFPWEEEVKA